MEFRESMFVAFSHAFHGTTHGRILSIDEWADRPLKMQLHTAAGMVVERLHPKEMRRVAIIPGNA